MATILASGGYDGIQLWDITSRHLLGEPLQAGVKIYKVAFSWDGKTLATATDDGTIRLWDTVSHQPLGEPLPTGLYIQSLVFSPDGKTLALLSDEGAPWLWDLDVQSWVKRACARVGRNFTTAEWAQFFPGETYRRTCEEYPLGD